LQDLVPGCNKITGKAGMLDEIIKYVQSLQRQVEVCIYFTYIYPSISLVLAHKHISNFFNLCLQFLSMKLAVVNPRLDFNMEALITEEVDNFPNTCILMVGS